MPTVTATPTSTCRSFWRVAEVAPCGPAANHVQPEDSPAGARPAGSQLSAWLGLPGAVLAFGIGVLLGTTMTLAYLTVHSTRRNPEGLQMPEFPLGTFVCTGGIVSCLWGPQIISAIMRFSS